MYYCGNLHYEKFADGSVKCIEDEIPFDLPDGWAWSRLLPLTTKIGAGSTPTGGAAVYSDSGIKFIRSQNVYDDGLVLDDVAYISESINQKKAGSIVKAKDILLNITGGSIGRCALVPDDFDIANVNQHVIIIRLIDTRLRHYLHSVIISPYIQEQIFSKQVGSGRGGLSAETLSTFLIPVPPIQEQSFIREKMNQCVSNISTIVTEKTEITSLVAAAKSKILDLAIRGQLVPQAPNDEPASVLLERIRAEKEELIKQGKIKRDKKESVIFRGEDNSYYFDIPDNWSLCPLKELFNVCSAKRVRQSDWRTEGVPFYRAREIVKLSDNGFVDNDLFISEEHYMRVKTECGVPEPGDLMVSGVGTIGKIYVVNSNDRFYYKDASVLCFENRTGAIDSQFARYMLESEFVQAQMKDNSKGTTVDTITISAAMEYICVLPPLAEQKRIVSAIKTAFMHLECISEALT